MTPFSLLYSYIKYPHLRFLFSPSHIIFLIFMLEEICTFNRTLQRSVLGTVLSWGPYTAGFRAANQFLGWVLWDQEQKTQLEEWAPEASLNPSEWRKSKEVNVVEGHKGDSTRRWFQRQKWVVEGRELDLLGLWRTWKTIVLRELESYWKVLSRKRPGC